MLFLSRGGTRSATQLRLRGPAGFPQHSQGWALQRMLPCSTTAFLNTAQVPAVGKQQHLPHELIHATQSCSELCFRFLVDTLIYNWALQTGKATPQHFLLSSCVKTLKSSGLAVLMASLQGYHKLLCLSADPPLYRWTLLMLHLLH